MTSLLTLPRLWAAAALACVFVAVSFTWVYPADFWWHLRLGEEVLSGKGIPAADVYSFTAQGQPFLYQSWLSGTIFALVYRVGGIPLIVFLNALCFLLAYGLLLSLCSWVARGSLRLAAVATLGAFLLGIENWAVRPQTFSVLLFSLTMWLLWRYALGRGRARSLACLPLISGLWANLHGAFPLSLVLQGTFILGLLVQRALWPLFARSREAEGPSPVVPQAASAHPEPHPEPRPEPRPELVEGLVEGPVEGRTGAAVRSWFDKLVLSPSASLRINSVEELTMSGQLRPTPSIQVTPPILASPRPLFLSFLASAFATLLTPYGLGVYEYLYTISTNPTIHSFILEWGRPTLDSTPGKAFHAALLGILILLFLGRGRVHPVSLLSLVVFGGLAASSLRNILWFGMAVAPLVASLLLAALPRVRWSVFLPASPADASSGPGPSPVATVAVVGFLLLLAFFALPWVRPSMPWPLERKDLLAPDTPVAATEALLAGAPRRVFADMQYASYLLWRLPERSRLFVDPRIELYPFNLWVQYGTISLGLDTELLDQYDVDALLLSQERQSGLLHWVRRQPDWWLVFEDNLASVWRRRT